MFSLALALPLSLVLVGAQPPVEVTPPDAPESAAPESASPESATPESASPESATPVPRPSPSMDDIVARAQKLSLADDEQWIRLGHWRSRGPLGWKSEADGPQFFLAPDGKTDPGAELEATLRGFFRPPTPDELLGNAKRPEKEGDVVPAQHPVCRFPARLRFLSQRLGLDLSGLGVHECPKLTRYVQMMSTSDISLVFSSYYLESPASAFGHTFLRIHHPRSMALSRERTLIDTGVDFSAIVDTKNALVYGFKGMTGLFPGVFQNMPYYYKIREYNDYESRDIWEYELNLTPEQLLIATLHIYELGTTWFDYYYATENCSYHILGVLEAANPDLELLKHTGFYVTPADTVKALYENPGLVREVRYRPSVRRQLLSRLEGLDGDIIERVWSLVSDPTLPLPEGLDQATQVRVLDAAADLVDYRYAKDLITDQGGEGSKVKQQILKRRAQIRVPSPTIEVTPPYSKQPQMGHDSGRLGLGTAMTIDGQPSALLNFRLTLHDLADRSDGYPELMQIEFLPTRLRLRLDKPRVELDEALLMRLASLSPLNSLDQSSSFRMEIGATTLRDSACPDCLVGKLLFAGGGTLAWWDNAIAVYLLGGGELNGGPKLSGIAGGPVRVGLFPELGLRLRFHRRLIAFAAARLQWLPFQSPETLWQGEATLRWSLLDNFAIGAEIRGSKGQQEAALMLFGYL